MKTKKSLIYLFIIFFIFIFFSNSIIATDLLEYGDKNEKVKEVQDILAHIGYDLDVDGIFGRETENSVKKFQLNNNLSVDGIVGEKTLNLLKDVSQKERYTVKKGDNLWNIARKFDTTVQAIKEENNLHDVLIRPGIDLQIPEEGKGGRREEEKNNIVHKVQSGETLIEIAHRYGTQVDTIKLANNLRNDFIHLGQELVIPHETRNGSFNLSEDKLIWPVLGRISSDFGWRKHPITGNKDFHSAIDIAIPVGEEIRAAAPGQVIYSNWRGGYGKTIIIDHGKNIKTLYAHNSRLLVAKGKYVNTGDIIALAGSTGVSTGSHLHFELIINSEEVNPLNYLP